MTVVDEAQHSKKYAHLRLVEFLELLCRVALVVELPLFDPDSIACTEAGADVENADAGNQKANDNEIADRVFMLLEVLYNKLYAHGVASAASCPLYPVDGAKDSSDDAVSDTETMISTRQLLANKKTTGLAAASSMQVVVEDKEKMVLT